MRGNVWQWTNDMHAWAHISIMPQNDKIEIERQIQQAKRLAAAQTNAFIQGQLREQIEALELELKLKPDET
jgi:formylglycine-generating enzyme required for sulfatase activity